MEKANVEIIQEKKREVEELHREIEQIKQAIQTLARSYDFLEDLEALPKIEEVDRLIAYEKKDAIRLCIKRMDGSYIVVYKKAKVNDIKLAVRDSVIRLLPENKQSRISWKYVWRKYCLQCEDGTLLLDNRNPISQYPLREGSSLQMCLKPIQRRIKKVRESKIGRRFYNPNLRR